MPSKPIALVLCGRRVFQERFLFGGDATPKSLLTKPLHDRLGINSRSHSDNAVKDQSPDCDLPSGTRTSLRVILNGWRSRVYRKSERVGPGLSGMHRVTSASD